MFNNIKQHIPKCFEEKIEIDRTYENLLKEVVIDFSKIKSAYYKRMNARYACEAHIKTQRGNGGSGGLA